MTLGRAHMLAEMDKAKRSEQPDVKFAGVIRKPKRPDPPTGRTTRAWGKMDDEGKLRFRNDIVEPWYRDVEVCGHNVVISRQPDGRSSRVELSGMGVQAPEPSELVIEFGTGLGVSIGSVDRGDEQAVDGRLEIAALPIEGVASRARAAERVPRLPFINIRHGVLPIGCT